MITMKENMCGSVNTRCLQSIASKCSVYQTNFNFFDQTKILAATGADLGGSSKYSNENFED